MNYFFLRKNIKCSKLPETQNKLIKVFFSILVGVGLNLEKFQWAPSSKSSFRVQPIPEIQLNVTQI